MNELHPYHIRRVVEYPLPRSIPLRISNRYLFGKPLESPRETSRELVGKPNLSKEIFRDSVLENIKKIMENERLSGAGHLIIIYHGSSLFINKVNGLSSYFLYALKELTLCGHSIHEHVYKILSKSLVQTICFWFSVPIVKQIVYVKKIFSVS